MATSALPDEAVNICRLITRGAGGGRSSTPGVRRAALLSTGFCPSSIASAPFGVLSVVLPPPRYKYGYSYN